jgi:hypothetical protein
MFLPIPILIVAAMMGMALLGLIRPPLTVILPLLGIYVILMFLPYLIPNVVIHQYLDPRYVALPIMGLALGYGVSLLVNRYLNVDVRSILGLRRDTAVIKRRASGKPRVERRPEIKPEDLDRVINESVQLLKLGVSTGKALGVWGEYYDGWADALLGIARGFQTIKESAETMMREAQLLSSFRGYEERALGLGFTVREESSFRKVRSRVGGDEVVVYVRPEEVTADVMASAQLVNDYVNKFENFFDKLIHESEQLSQYIANSPVLVMYVEGIPQKIIILHS